MPFKIAQILPARDPLLNSQLANLSTLTTRPLSENPDGLERWRLPQHYLQGLRRRLELELQLFETGKAGYDAERKTSGKSDGLRGAKQAVIDSPVAVFVVKYHDRVGSRRQSLEMEGRNGILYGSGLLPAARPQNIVAGKEQFGDGLPPCVREAHSMNG